MRQREGVRLLIVPGLHGSGEAHWQTWLQARYRGARRVEQADWSVPDLPAWSARIAETLDAAPGVRWVAAAHSFGCLALAHHLVTHPASAVAAALLVAPAAPARLGVEAITPRSRLARPGMVVGSDTDPWMSAVEARTRAREWGLTYRHLGDAGHINTEAGFGPLPPARQWIDALVRRLERDARVTRADVREFAFAV